ncbi:Uncharacterised protein [uncultured archaeon]|nr:Uncharacterised protein [uncultured archaeon]
MSPEPRKKSAVDSFICNAIILTLGTMEETKLIKADSKIGSQSAKSTIPRSFLNQWNLKAGATLLWEFAYLEETGELVVIVKPAKHIKVKKVKKKGENK